MNSLIEKEKEYYNQKNFYNENYKELDNKYIEYPKIANIEKENKFKKNQECEFLIVNDPMFKREIIETTKCKEGASSFIFWFKKEQPDKWGLTIKYFPKNTRMKNNDGKSYGKSDYQQETWKITWYYEEGILKLAQNSLGLANDISQNDFKKLKEYLKYIKENNFFNLNKTK